MRRISQAVEGARGGGLLLLMLSALVLITAHGTAIADVSRPAEGDQPTPVYVRIGVLDVDEIDAASQNFTASVFYQVRWHDPRQAHDGPGSVQRPLAEVWHPQLLFINQQQVWTTLLGGVQITPDGEVYYRQRIWGRFSQPMNLKDFPFDLESFEVHLASGGYSPKQVELLSDPEGASGVAESLSLPDWDVLGWTTRTSIYRVAKGGEGTSAMTLSIEARRQVGYYIFSIIIPLVLIVAMSWTVFWIDPTQFGTQISVSTTSMLTLIAYRFMVGGHLPKVSYLTRMDLFILGATVLVFLTLIEAVISAALARGGRTPRAQMLDRWCRVIVPGAFVFVCVLAFLV